MNKNLITLIIIVVSATIMYIISGLPQPKVVICTKEAFVCPDGSTVGRVGPRCQFATCPKAAHEPTATPSATLSR